MQKTILIGEKEFKFRASALTSMLYKDLFGEDLIRELPKIQENAAVDKIIGLAFVMNFQATSKNALEESKEKLTIANYYAWLDQFEQLEVLNRDFVKDITALWLSNTATSSTAKNLNRLQ